MPSTIHKILIHGCEIFSSFELPVGQLAKDTLEATHKELRKTRLHHTRKASRMQSNTDLIRTLLITSEPKLAYLSNISKSQKTTVEGDMEIQEYLLDNENRELLFFENDLDENINDI